MPSSNDTPTTTDSSVFRSAQTPTEAAEQAPTPEPNADQPVTSYAKADGLYVGYENDHGVPYVANFYGIGNLYNQEPDTYHEEIDAIGKHIEQLIGDGELSNSLEAVDLKLKQLEKLAGVDKTERTVMKLIRLAEYCKFMNNVNNAKRNMSKYGSSR